MTDISNQKGQILPFKRKNMENAPVVIDSFEEVSFPEGQDGVYYVLLYPNGRERLAYMFAEAGETDYDSLFLVKEGEEEHVAKDKNGNAKTIGRLPKGFLTQDSVETVIPSIREWHTGTVPQRNQRVEEAIKAYRPLGLYGSSAARAACKIVNG